MTTPATCRSCGKIPEPGSPFGLCSRCLMARLVERPPAVRPPSGSDYEKGRELAMGGMGAVMEAHDLTLHRTVAMKVMHPKAASQARARFDREARVLARLEHPNIVPIHAMGTDAEGRPFYTMKLVRGVTLQDILDLLRKGDEPTVGRYTLSELLGIFQEVGQGNVLVVDATSRSVLQKIPTGLAGFLQMSISSDAGQLAVAKFGGNELLVFDFPSGKLRQRVPTPGGTIDWIGFPQGDNERVFVIEASPPTGRMLDLRGGRTVWVTRAGVKAAFDPTGRLMAFPGVTLNQDVRLVDVRTGQSLRTMDPGGDRAYVWQVAFSPDGTMLAGGDHLGDVHMWEVATGRLLRRFNAGVGRLQGLAFGPDETLITVCEEGREDATSPRSLRVWNWRHASELAAFIGLDPREMNFAFDAKTGLVLTPGAALNCYRVPLGQAQVTINSTSPGRFVRFVGEGHLFAATEISFVGIYSLANPARETWTAPTKPRASGPWARPLPLRRPNGAVTAARCSRVRQVQEHQAGLRSSFGEHSQGT